ncbi:hypothetical protein D9757_003262 [Collybiopsis confluens]|uniref:Survival protein SurE-like phosphatase/nucleotidase domain-containing protein n=1 Tax=Collybiopsis confluens TaxID=2823264 RepID=A0A8H5HZ12_9AGAR|nr:hypothetical protein D9757_003262 [Collybiopsis confluens]
MLSPMNPLDTCMFVEKNSSRWIVLLFASSPSIYGERIVLGNDDGWATAAVRAQFTALVNAGFDVVLSCPAVDQSGTGPLSITPIPLLFGSCEFDSCPQFSPAEGSDPSDPRINYVNAFPRDAMNYGINTLAPKLLGGPPDLAVSGPNTGHNVGVLIGSGTVNAARQATLDGIPSIAFSGTSGLSHVSYTTLSDPTSADTIAANLFAQLSIELIDALLSSPAPGPLLPENVSLNVNYPSTTSNSSCTSISDFKFVLTRVLPDPLVTDVETCGTNHLPAESDVVEMEGCFASVSVFDVNSYLDVDAATQAVVLNRLGSFLSCVS